MPPCCVSFDHDIRLETEAVPSDRRSWNYTCFQQAFDLVDPPPVVVKIANFDHGIYPNAEFVAYLGRNLLTAVRPEQVAEDDVVGQMHLWRHRLFEVPLRYGSTVQFYRSISRLESIEAFIRYAESKLGRASVDALRTGCENA